MVTAFTEHGSSSERVLFDPESGWCVLDRDDVFLVNPAAVAEHRLEGSFADMFRTALESGAVLPDTLRNMLPFRGESLKNALRSGRFLRDPSPTRVLGLDDPRQLWIEVQGSCNEQCVHCYADSAPKDLPSLDRGTVEDVVRDASELGFSMIQFTGGDPLLWDDLPEMVGLARDLGVDSEIYTNGLLLEEELYRDLVVHDPRFAFSFYSHEPEVHDSITQHSGSWERTLEAIDRALRGPTPVRVGVVMMEENQGQREEIVEFLKDRGLDGDSINVAYTQAVGRGRSRGTSGEFSGSGSSGSPESTEDSGHLSGERRSFNPGKLCVSYRGDVIPCIFQRDLSLGSVHRDSLKEIVRNPDLGRTAGALTSDHEVPHDPDRLSCSECRFHAFVLHYLLGNPQSLLSEGLAHG